MEVNKLLSDNLYRSYCTQLQYDGHVNRFLFCRCNISNEELLDLKSYVFCKIGKNLSVDDLTNRVNALMAEINSPSFRFVDVIPETYFGNILAGECVEVLCGKENYTLELIKYNKNSWKILNSNVSGFQIGDFVGMSKADDLYCFFEGADKRFVFSGFYHDAIDRIFIPEVSKRNVSSSISDLYDKVDELVNCDTVCENWAELLRFAANLGFGSFVVRRILDSVTSRCYERGNK